MSPAVHVYSARARARGVTRFVCSCAPGLDLIPMPFLIETFDKPDSFAIRKQMLAAHLDFLDQQKHLLIAGGDKRSDDGKRVLGAIYLVRLETRQEAASFIAADPYATADLFERVTILRWDQAYLDGQPQLPRRRPQRRPLPAK